MKRPHLLLVLLLLATGAGVLLHLARPHAPGEQRDDDHAGRAAVLRVRLEQESGFTFKRPPETIRVSDEELFARIDSFLTRRFGKEGLVHRSEAFALLSLLPPGQDLREQWIKAHGAGAQGWFDSDSGTIYLHEDFGGNTLADQAALLRLQARALLHQHHPPGPSPLSDDQANMREALHGGIAAVLESDFRASLGTGQALPTSAETEREATLLSLPIYLHNLVQLPLMQGKDHVMARRAQGLSFDAILREAPIHSLALLNPGATPSPPPDLPPVADVLLRESLGAYASQLLCERLSDYLVAESLGAAWRADQYLYFQTPEGKNLFWVSQWESSEAAARFAALLERETTAPGNPTGPRLHRRVTVDGPIVRLAHGPGQSTLDALLPAALSSPRAKVPAPNP